MTETAEFAGTWSVDPAATKVTLSSKNFGFRTVDASVRVVDGTAQVGADATTSSLTARIDARSFDTGNQKRDDHVRSDDFFAAEEHPEITFTSKAVRAGAVGFEVDGDLTIRATTSPLTVLVQDVEPAGEGRVRFLASATVDRNAAGVSKLPSLMIGRNVGVRVEGEATKQ